MPEWWSWGSFWLGALTMYLVFVIAWVFCMKVHRDIKEYLDFNKAKQGTK